MATLDEEITFRSAFGDFDDHASYREWASAFMAQTRAQGGTRHFITNTEIEVDGERAVHRCYLTIIMRRHRQFYTSAFTHILLRTDGAGASASGASKPTRRCQTGCLLRLTGG